MKYRLSKITILHLKFNLSELGLILQNNAPIKSSWLYVIDFRTVALYLIFLC